MLFDLPYEYEDEGAIDWNLICSICSNPYTEPIITKCKHIFCYDCIELWFEKNPTCPICREHILEDQYFWLTDESILTQLQQLSVKCSLCEKKQILRTDIADHLAHQCSSVNGSSARKTVREPNVRSDEPRARTSEYDSTGNGFNRIVDRRFRSTTLVTNEFGASDSTVSVRISNHLT